MRSFSYLLLLLPTPLYGTVDISEETTPLIDFFLTPMALVTLLLCALTAWILYQKETAEEKYWIQFYGRIFPYFLIFFLLFLILTILLGIVS